MSASLILLVIAAVCFALAGFGVSVSRLNLIALGLLAWVISQLL